jgi:hypothetical protein
MTYSTLVPTTFITLGFSSFWAICSSMTGFLTKTAAILAMWTHKILFPIAKVWTIVPSMTLLPTMFAEERYTFHLKPTHSAVFWVHEKQLLFV